MYKAGTDYGLRIIALYLKDALALDQSMKSQQHTNIICDRRKKLQMMCERWAQESNQNDKKRD